MTQNLDAIVFVYRNNKDKTIKSEYFEKARLLEDSPDWEHIATLEPRIWIEFNYDTVEKAKQEPDDLTIAYMSGVHDGKKKRTWVGLTDDDRRVIYRSNVYAFDIIQATEARLKQKNGYTEEKN